MIEISLNLFGKNKLEKKRKWSKSPQPPLERQGGFIQEKKNAKTHLLRRQPPATKVRANVKSPLKGTKWFFFRCMKPPCFPRGVGGIQISKRSLLVLNRRSRVPTRGTPTDSDYQPFHRVLFVGIDNYARCPLFVSPYIPAILIMICVIR